MVNRDRFSKLSFETNLFFQRIMKEHLFFVETNLQPAAPSHIAKAKELKLSMEKLLAEAVHYSNCLISDNALKSNEFVTPYTLKAEEVTSALTGASLDMEITKAELKLVCDPRFSYENYFEAADSLNKRTYKLLQEVIKFQKELIEEDLACEIFIPLYPQMLEHDTHEAELYLSILESLVNMQMPELSTCDEVNFWNMIMAEHAEFFDGMLDPTEKELKALAAAAAEKFNELEDECTQATQIKLLNESKEATRKLKQYKVDIATGLLRCKIKSIIPPLLADHVLREANHYLRLMSNNPYMG